MKNRLGILLVLVLVLGLCAYVAVSQQKGGAGSEADPSLVSAAGTDAGSIEDYYPKLNSSYGGYPIPTPDGSLRLTCLVRNPDSPSMLVVKTDFNYDDDGNLTGTECYFDTAASYQYFKLFFGWDPDSCLVEADDQGRLSKVIVYPDTEYEYYTEFTYLDYRDVQKSFHAKTVYNDGSVHERDVVSEDYDARNEIQKTQSELSPDSEFEYDEDGLVTRARMAEWSDMEGRRISKTYIYQYVADSDGFLEYVYSYSSGRISFNKHGYLAEYPVEPAGGGYYEYQYAPAV